MLEKLKSLANRVAHRARPLPAGGAVTPAPPVQGREMPSFYYDEAFSRKPDFQVPFYKSSYYPTWLLVVDRLRRYGCERILDVGCGPGQFAQLCDDWGFQSYVGIDFSAVALDMARAKAPRFEFRVGDIKDKATYEGIGFNAIVCMEVLEHIDDDGAVISCFPEGVRCLMTVPNFPYRSHVRHFETEGAVMERYGGYFTEFTVRRIKGVRAETEQFYLMDAVR
jgi:SAM-dependent methyltransferase